MYNVLIADDEEIVYKGMCNILDWQSLGFRILGFAENGKEALEKLERDHYNLIVTDIRMPVIDGLDLIKEIRGMNPDTRIIILSGYSEFSYAQKAIEYGVKGYLVKPIDREKLRGLVLSIKAELDAEAEEELLRNESISALKDKFICDIACGHRTEAEITEKSFQYGLDLTGKQYFVALFEIRSFPDLMEKSIESAKTVFLSAKQTIESMVKEENMGCVYEDAEGVIGVLFYNESVLACYKDRMECIYRICTSVSEAIGLEISAGTGDPADSLKSVKISRSQAYKALEERKMIELSQQRLPRIVFQILRFINEHYTEDITLKSIAKRFYLNPAYLGQLLIKTTGEAFNDYLNRKRIAEVKRLLVTKEYAAMELIEKAGYRNPEYFYRQFKRYEGMAYSEYRNTIAFPETAHIRNLAKEDTN